MPPVTHIAFLDGSPADGGAQRSLAELAAALPPEIAVTWIASRLPPELARRPGVAFHEFRCRPWPKTPLGLWRLWQDRRRFQRLWQKIQADKKADGSDGAIPQLLHVNGEPSLLLLPAPKAVGCPALLHVRDVRMPGVVRLKACQRAERIVAISTFTASTLPRTAWPKIRIVHNGIGNTLSATQAVPTEAPLDGSRRKPQGCRLVTVADLVPWKRHGLFLETLAVLRRQDPEAQGVVVGRPRDPAGERLLDKLWFQADRLGLAEAVEFVTDCTDVTARIEQSDLLVSTAEHEPFGRTIVEALRLGKPVVAIADGGPAEILAGCQAGFLAATAEPEELARLCLAARDRLRTQGDALQESAIARANGFTIDRTAEAMLAVYAELLEETP